MSGPSRLLPSHARFVRPTRGIDCHTTACDSLHTSRTLHTPSPRFDRQPHGLDDRMAIRSWQGACMSRMMTWWTTLHLRKQHRDASNKKHDAILRKGHLGMRNAHPPWSRQLCFSAGTSSISFLIPKDDSHAADFHVTSVAREIDKLPARDVCLTPMPSETSRLNIDTMWSECEEVSRICSGEPYLARNSRNAAAQGACRCARHGWGPRTGADILCVAVCGPSPCVHTRARPLRRSLFWRAWSPSLRLFRRLCYICPHVRDLPKQAGCIYRHPQAPSYIQSKGEKICPFEFLQWRSGPLPSLLHCICQPSVGRLAAFPCVLFHLVCSSEPVCEHGRAFRMPLAVAATFIRPS
jgi:hypothetical protein